METEMSTIPVPPFAALAEVKYVGKQSAWEHCTVVGISLGINDSCFIVMREADGEVWPDYASYVRRVEKSDQDQHLAPTNDSLHYIK